MSYWHWPNGDRAPWGKGQFDGSHLAPLLPLLFFVGVVLSGHCMGGK